MGSGEDRAGEIGNLPPQPSRPFPALSETQVREELELMQAQHQERLQARITELEAQLPPGKVRFRGSWMYCEDEFGMGRFFTGPEVDLDEWAYVAPVMWIDDPEWTNKHGGGKDTRQTPTTPGDRDA